MIQGGYYTLDLLGKEDYNDIKVYNLVKEASLNHKPLLISFDYLYETPITFFATLSIRIENGKFSNYIIYVPYNFNEGTDTGTIEIHPNGDIQFNGF